MCRLTSAILALFFLLSNCFYSSALAATRNVVVTAGTGQMYYDDVQLSLAGQGYAANWEAWVQQVHLYREGNTNGTEYVYPGSNNVQIEISSFDMSGGAHVAMLDGAALFPVYYSGSVKLLSEPVTFPNVQVAAVTLTIPFTMTAHVTGFKISPMTAHRPDDVVYEADLSGQGIMTAEFTGFYSDQFQRWQYELQKRSLTYIFQPASNQPETVRLSASSYTVNEGDPSRVANVTVNRIGGTFGTSSVDYKTFGGGLPKCQTQTFGGASDKCDFATTTGTLHFAPGETSKTIQIPIINDAYVEADEGFSITLFNPRGERLGTNAGAAIIIKDDDTQAATGNPIDNQAFFIRQHYVDFLGRVAEPAGFDFWNSRMNNCPQGQTCDRIDTSLRFFQSEEFRDRSFFLYRLMDVVLGVIPDYDWFMTRASRLNGFLSVGEQRMAKDELLKEFVTSPSFKTKYGNYVSADSMTAKDPAGFVNALSAQAGITPASKQTLINNLQSGARDVPHTVEDFINTPEISGVGTLFYDRGFITMQYYGYLRRTPEQAGFDFWVGQLIGPNAPHRGDYRFMVGGFLQSHEYRFRFAMQ